jgi:hypothetical protein
MPPQHRGFKSINHRDTQYRWFIRNSGGINELHVEASETVNGQILKAILPRVVSSNMVIAAIDFGNANGWKRNESGPIFHCRRTREGFLMVSDEK